MPALNPLFLIPRRRREGQTGYVDVSDNITEAEATSIDEALEEARRQFRKLRPMPEKSDMNWDDEDDFSGVKAYRQWKLRPMKSSKSNSEITVCLPVFVALAEHCRMYSRAFSQRKPMCLSRSTSCSGSAFSLRSSSASRSMC
jgi:hypothetical protein